MGSVNLWLEIGVIFFSPLEYPSSLDLEKDDGEKRDYHNDDRHPTKERIFHAVLIHDQEYSEEQTYDEE